MRDLEYLRRVNNPRKREPKEREGDKLGPNAGNPDALALERWHAKQAVRDFFENNVPPGRNVFVRESDCGLVREVAAVLDAAHEETADNDADPYTEARRAAP
jgi:hypothetical protein